MMTPMRSRKMCGSERLVVVRVMCFPERLVSVETIALLARFPSYNLEVV